MKNTQFQTNVTQKGQITLPKAFRDALNIKPYDTVTITLGENTIIVDSKPDILDLAGSLKVQNKKPLLQARSAMEKNYKRF